MTHNDWFFENHDLIINNANILTQSPSMPVARSLRVRNGIIAEVSSEQIQDQTSKTIDVQGATVLPGFNDVHAHSVWFGLTTLELDCSQADSVEDLYRLIATKAESTPSHEWIIGAGFNPIRMGDQYPDRDLLDKAAHGRPVWLKHNSGHSAQINGVALGLIEESHDLSLPIEGGKLVRDASGRFTGLLEETALSLVQALVMPYSMDRIVDALEAATRQYLREGITSVTDAGIGGGWIGHSPREFGAYQAALSQGKLHTRMQPMFVLDALHELAGHHSEEAVLGLDGGIVTGAGNDWLQLGPVKVFVDGSLLGSTAALTEEYLDCPGNHGYLQGDPEHLRSRIIKAYAGGWSLAIHAIGDHAVDFAIDTIREAQAAYGVRSIPCRIEHVGIVRDNQLSSLAELGVAVVPQPRFLYEFGDAMVRRIGPNRAAQLYRAKSFLENGIILPGSSDRPVAQGEPLPIMQSFIDRESSTGEVIGAEERLSVEQALYAYTMGSAQATGQSHRKGSIEVGKLADITVLSDDPRALDGGFSSTKVLATMVGGKLSFGWEQFA